MRLIVLFVILTVVILGGCIVDQPMSVKKVPKRTPIEKTQVNSTSTVDNTVRILLNAEGYGPADKINLDIENNRGRSMFIYGMSGIHPWYMVSVFVEIRENDTWTMLVNGSDYGEGAVDIEVPPLLIERGGAYHMEWNHQIPAPMNGTYRFGLKYHFTEDDNKTQIAYSAKFTINKK